MCYTNLQMYVYPDGYQQTFASSHLCPASIEGQLCPRHNFVTLAPMRVPFANQVPQAFGNPASGYSAPFMGQFPPAPPYNPHMYPPSPPHNPHSSASSPRHSPDENSTSPKRPAKEDAQPRQSTSRRPTAGEKRSHRRRDKARIVIDIDVADDSSCEEQPAEGKRHNDHCDNCNHHSHSDDDKVPHRRRSQRYEPERPKPPPTPGPSPPPFHSGPSNGAKAAQDRQEIDELRETVRRLERKMREEREWGAQRRRSEERSSRPRRRTTAGGCDCDGYYQNGDYRWY
ncbi:hypothetical protein E4U59_004812 [Claviceps monticola]|nr:hypothetical protein E4U59_004812 [Claviceps monticola]